MVFEIIFPSAVVFQEEVTIEMPYFFAVSSDTLYVVEKNKEEWTAIEQICVGTDCDGVVCGFYDVDDMLDAINIIKEVIKSGNNPIHVCGIY